MELAPRKNELYKNEFPSIKISPFDAELNSASNGDTFIHGKTFGKNFTRIFFFSYTYIRVHVWCPGANFSLRNEFPFIELSSFNAELNSESIELILMDGNSFLYNSFFRGASFTSILVIHIEMLSIFLIIKIIYLFFFFCWSLLFELVPLNTLFKRSINSIKRPFTIFNGLFW